MNKKIPLRKCIGCGNMISKKEMIRIVKTKENDVFIDTTGKANGRGTYVCSIDCALKVVKKKMLDKAFCEKIDSEIYENLISTLEKMQSNEEK